jgi:hypothetical protein
VFEQKVLKILFGTKAGEIEQTGIPATLVDLCWEGVWFESHLEDQISWQFFFGGVWFSCLLADVRAVL